MRYRLCCKRYRTRYRRFLTYLLLDYFGLNPGLNEFIMLGVIFAVRMLAVKFDWHLPSIVSLIDTNNHLAALMLNIALDTTLILLLTAFVIIFIR